MRLRVCKFELMEDQVKCKAASLHSVEVQEALMLARRVYLELERVLSHQTPFELSSKVEIRCSELKGLRRKKKSEFSELGKSEKTHSA